MYRILKHQRYDECCIRQEEWFTVEFKRRGWFKRTIWEPLQEDSGWDDLRDQRFETLDKACDTAERVKCGDPRNETVTFVREVVE